MDLDKVYSIFRKRGFVFKSYSQLKPHTLPTRTIFKGFLYDPFFWSGSFFCVLLTHLFLFNRFFFRACLFSPIPFFYMCAYWRGKKEDFRTIPFNMRLFFFYLFFFLLMLFFFSACNKEISTIVCCIDLYIYVHVSYMYIQWYSR